MNQAPINITVFKSLPRRNVFAPAWEFPIGEDKITTVNFKKLAKLILKKECVKFIVLFPMYLYNYIAIWYKKICPQRSSSNLCFAAR